MFSSSSMIHAKTPSAPRGRFLHRRPSFPTKPQSPEICKLASMASLSHPISSGFGSDSGLPANVDAERTILGAILLENQALSEAEEKLTPDDFSLDSHRRIYQRMTELGGEGRAVDLVPLANELAKYKEIESVG